MVLRCENYNDEKLMRCQEYRIDVLGGERIGPIIKEPIGDRMVCFPQRESWLPLANWRDESILYWQDQQSKSIERKKEMCSEALDVEEDYFD